MFEPRPPLLLLKVPDYELSSLIENRLDYLDPPLLTNVRAAYREFPPPNIEFIVPPLIGDITPCGISGSSYFWGEIAIAIA